ncbi:hypothetical protein ES707_07373 [subsurface metagenome]
MEVSELVDIIQRVCGLPINWAKTCIYYCMATHKLGKIDWMPILLLLGRPSSGKSKLMNVLIQLARVKNPPEDSLFSCEGISYPTLRDGLAKNYLRTAFLEEADQHPNRKQLEGLLLARVDKKGTSRLKGKEAPKAGGRYRDVTRNLFGAAIVHDRHGLNDLATERRAIVVPIKRYEDRIFEEPPTGLSLTPKFSLGNIPNTFNTPKTRGSGLNTWEPLIRIASSLGDRDWLSWAKEQVIEANRALVNGYQYEQELTIFKAVIKGYCDRTSGVLDENNIASQPLLLSTVTNTVKKDYTWIAPKTIGTTLRKMHLDVHTKGGDTHIFTKLDQLKKIAQEIGYEDEVMRI